MKSTQLCACGCGNYTDIAPKTDSRRGQVKGQPMKFISGHNNMVNKEDYEQQKSELEALQKSLQDQKQALDTQLREVNERVANAEVVISSYGEVTQEKIVQMRLWDDLKAADYYDARVKSLEVMNKRTFVEMGLIVNEVEARNLWAKLVDPTTGIYYHSLDQWIMIAAPVSRSSAYAAKKAVKQLSHIPVQELEQMPRFALEAMSGLSTTVQKDPELIEAAKTLPEKEFREKIQANYPDQHIEPKRKTLATLPESSKKMFDKAIEISMYLHDSTRDEAVLDISVNYINDYQAEYDEQKSNEKRITR